MPGFVSESEVIKRMWKLQAFGECLHDVAFIRYKVLTDFYGDRERKGRFMPKQGDKTARKVRGRSVPFAYVCGILH